MKRQDRLLIELAIIFIAFGFVLGMFTLHIIIISNIQSGSWEDSGYYYSPVICHTEKVCLPQSECLTPKDVYRVNTSFSNSLWNELGEIK